MLRLLLFVLLLQLCTVVTEENNSIRCLARQFTKIHIAKDEVYSILSPYPNLKTKCGFRITADERNIVIWCPSKYYNLGEKDTIIVRDATLGTNSLFSKERSLVRMTTGSSIIFAYSSEGVGSNDGFYCVLHAVPRDPEDVTLISTTTSVATEPTVEVKNYASLNSTTILKKSGEVAHAEETPRSSASSLEILQCADATDFPSVIIKEGSRKALIASNTGSTSSVRCGWRLLAGAGNYLYVLCPKEHLRLTAGDTILVRDIITKENKIYTADNSNSNILLKSTAILFGYHPSTEDSLGKGFRCYVAVTDAKALARSEGTGPSKNVLPEESLAKRLGRPNVETNIQKEESTKIPTENDVTETDTLSTEISEDYVTLKVTTAKSIFETTEFINELYNTNFIDENSIVTPDDEIPINAYDTTPIPTEYNAPEMFDFHETSLEPSTDSDLLDQEFSFSSTPPAVMHPVNYSLSTPMSDENEIIYSNYTTNTETINNAYSYSQVNATTATESSKTAKYVQINFLVDLFDTTKPIQSVETTTAYSSYI